MQESGLVAYAIGTHRIMVDKPARHRQLRCGFATAHDWAAGPELVRICNDGYREVTGKKYPAALGQPRCLCWPKAWKLNALLYEGVTNRCETFTFKDQRLVLEHRVHLEETCSTLRYSLVFDD